MGKNKQISLDDDYQSDWENSSEPISDQIDSEDRTTAHRTTPRLAKVQVASHALTARGSSDIELVHIEQGLEGRHIQILSEGWRRK
jgi:hypothetical protein